MPQNRLPELRCVLTHSTASRRCRRSLPRRPLARADWRPRQLVDFCEDTATCRHAAIARYFGDRQPAECDYACDVCKDRDAVARAKRDGLAAEEWVSTQRNSGSLFWGMGDYED